MTNQELAEIERRCTEAIGIQGNETSMSPENDARMIKFGFWAREAVLELVAAHREALEALADEQQRAPMAERAATVRVDKLKAAISQAQVQIGNGEHQAAAVTLAAAAQFI